MRSKHQALIGIGAGLALGVLALLWVKLPAYEARITALEFKAVEQHEAEFATCDLCGREFERDRGIWFGMNMETLWEWDVDAKRYLATRTWGGSPGYALCPRCVRALQAQLVTPAMKGAYHE